MDAPIHLGGSAAAVRQRAGVVVTGAVMPHGAHWMIRWRQGYAAMCPVEPPDPGST